MKKIIIAALAICLAFALSGCGSLKDLQIPVPPFLKSENNVSSGVNIQAQEVPVQTPEPVPEKQPIEIYAPVIEKYISAAASKMAAEDLIKVDLNYMAAYCYGDSPLERLGYLLYDLDADGIPELLIGSRIGDEYQDKIVLELYTIKDSQPVRLFSSGERQRYYLCSDGTIANENSSSAFASSNIYYKYAGGELTVTDSIIFDMAADRNAPWFYEAGGERTKIEESAALARMSEMQAKYVVLNYTPFSQY